jgi:hypothetical protein
MRTLMMAALLVMTACGGEVAEVTARAIDGEVLMLPASSATGVTTAGPLLRGVTYDVVIEGSVSAWPPEAWSSVCAGTPSPAPRFASPGPTGPVGVDAEWVWAWPKASPSLCPDGVPSGTPPGAARHIVLRGGSGAESTSLPPALETTMTSNHAYTYRLVGTGEAAVFLFSDSHPSDNYGEFQIQISAP